MLTVPVSGKGAAFKPDPGRCKLGYTNFQTPSKGLALRTFPDERKEIRVKIFFSLFHLLDKQKYLT
jgi:hypothetical protein